MFNFEVDYTGADKVRNALNGISESFSGKQTRSILQKVAAMYIAETEDRFKNENDLDRKKWPSLSPVTIRLKQKGYEGRKPAAHGATRIGVWTGDLSSSIKYRIEGDTVIIGSDVKYAKHFHYRVPKGGGKVGWGTSPSRRFLGRNTRIDSKVIQVVRNELIKATGLDINSISSAV